jgi:hypothetical protein
MTAIILGGIVLLCIIGGLGWKLGGGNIPLNLSAIRSILRRYYDKN